MNLEINEDIFEEIQVEFAQKNDPNISQVSNVTTYSITNIKPCFVTNCINK